MTLPDPIIPASEVAIIDHAAERLGCDIGELMQRAGTAVAELAQRLAPHGPILVACGSGNNGGDGYVAARLLAEAGREVWCWAVSDPRSLLCDQEAGRLPDTVRRIAGIVADDVPALIIDAILGAGAKGPPRISQREALAQLRSLGAPCLAVDLPTGLASEEHITPCHCLCLQAAKRELIQRDDCEISVADIGIPKRAWAEVTSSAFRHFPLHRNDGHKGQHGRLAVIAGWTYPGAGQLACRAALASGCDLVHAWAPDDCQLPAGIVHHRRARTGGHDDLDSLLAQVDAILIGPGLGRDAQAAALCQATWGIAAERHLPLIIDADALVLLADRIAGDRHPELLCCPHAAELTAICGDAVDAAQTHAFARPNRVILAKGRHDLITDGLRWQRNHSGNPRLCVGGSGDCLAGLAAGLRARGCEAFDAARLAVRWLCSSGDQCWQEAGPCYGPDEIIDRLPLTLRQLLAKADMPWPPVAPAED